MNIYRLKRTFGRDVTLYKFISETSNLVTGVKERAYMTYHIHKAIVMSALDARLVVSDFWKDSTSSLLVLDTTIEPTILDHCEFDGKRYTFKTVKHIENLFLIAIEDSGLPPIGINILKTEAIVLMQDVTLELEGAPLDISSVETMLEFYEDSRLIYEDYEYGVP